MLVIQELLVSQAKPIFNKQLVYEARHVIGEVAEGRSPLHEKIPQTQTASSACRSGLGEEPLLMAISSLFVNEIGQSKSVSLVLPLPSKKRFRVIKGQ